MLVPDSSGSWVDGRAYTVAEKIRHGDPAVGWPGDPELELHWRPSHHRWEIHRLCEDGAVRALAWWAPEELETIPTCLNQMRLDAPGHVPVEERIDANNARVEEEVWSRYRDKLGEMHDHWQRLVADTHGPRTTFRGIPGRRDE